jgi:glutathione S-transferase
VKNIVFCADGTWNGTDRDDDGDGQPDVTNVVRLFSLLDGATTPETLRLHDEQEKQLMDSSGVRQVAKYLHGVGDSRNAITKILGGVFGAGLVGRIVRGYTFISREYQPGDRIYITGFSRGAYTARALAGFVTTMGLLKPVANDDRELAYKKGIGAWAAYRRKAGLSGSLLDSFDELNGKPVSSDDFVTPVKVTAVGVWDTVGAYGIPVYNPFHVSRLDIFKFANTTLSPSVENGFHAVAIDEERTDFVPTLWDDRAGVEQVWFGGAHADVGGGYPGPVLPLYALGWMVDRLREAGAIFVADLPPGPASFEAIHRPWEEHPFKGLPHQARAIPAGARFHRSVQMMLDTVPGYAPKSLQPFQQGRNLRPDMIVD